MAIPKKGFRKVIVDDNEFLWKVRKKVSWNEIHDGQLGVPIQNVKGGQLLILTIGYSRSYFIENNEFEITPSIIEICIREAIIDGWSHKTKGSQYEFDCSRSLSDFYQSIDMSVLFFDFTLNLMA